MKPFFKQWVRGRSEFDGAATTLHVHLGNSLWGSCRLRAVVQAQSCSLLQNSLNVQHRIYFTHIQLNIRHLPQ